MAKGNFSGKGGEYIHHFTSVRMRLQGDGNLMMRLIGLDNIREYVMKDLVMSEEPGIEPTRLCNFRSQRTQFEGKTIEFDEFVQISRIILFVKASATSYPM